MQDGLGELDEGRIRWKESRHTRYEGSAAYVGFRLSHRIRDRYIARHIDGEIGIRVQMRHLSLDR